MVTPRDRGLWLHQGSEDYGYIKGLRIMAIQLIRAKQTPQSMSLSGVQTGERIAWPNPMCQLTTSIILMPHTYTIDTKDDNKDNIFA